LISSFYKFNRAGPFLCKDDKENLAGAHEDTVFARVSLS